MKTEFKTQLEYYCQLNQRQMDTQTILPVSHPSGSLVERDDGEDGERRLSLVGNQDEPLVARGRGGGPVVVGAGGDEVAPAVADVLAAGPRGGGAAVL